MEIYNLKITKDGRLNIIELPFDAKKVFNQPKGTIYIKGTMNGIDYRSKLLSKGDGKQFMIINKELLNKLDFQKGQSDNVKMTIQPDNVKSNITMAEVISESDKNVLEAITTRKSIRKYSDKEISDLQINTIINAGLCAPSATNKRPFHFIVLRDKEKKQLISRSNKYAKMVENAPVCIIVCGDKAKQGIQELLIEDCSAATMNILLAIHGLNLGAVWCGVLMKSEWYKLIRNTLNLPDKIIPVSVIALGYPDESRTIDPRFDTAKLHYDCW